MASIFHACNLYIPLRSDKTRFCAVRGARSVFLYIPLRSDKTQLAIVKRDVVDALYPTTFR